MERLLTDADLNARWPHFATPVKARWRIERHDVADRLGDAVRAVVGENLTIPGEDERPRARGVDVPQGARRTEMMRRFIHERHRTQRCA